ncbi:MAG: PepSY-associated TM helix domain-containing protein [Pseudomonadota bacterium]
MDRDRRVRIYDAHSWTGIALGLFLFMVCFTGSVALFDHELVSWEDPARRLAIAENPVPVQSLFEEWVAEYPPEKVTFLSITYPSVYEPYYLGRINYQPEEGAPIEFLQRRWSTHDGSILPEREDGLATWLLGIHRDLMWPDFLGGRTIGRGLVGIAGVIMLLSIVTGILTHRKILKEVFTYRTKKSVRVKWKDAHNFLGIWSLPFSITIAFTGAWLGIVALLLPVTAMLVFKGDTEQVVELLVGADPDRAGISAPMLSLDDVAQRPHSESGALPVTVFAFNWGDENAIYTVNYKPENKLTYYDVERINGVTGEMLPLAGILEPAASTRTIAAVSPLHYGTYGGIALKYLYFGLGIAMSLMVALGNMVWIERRAHSAEGSRSPQFYDRLARLTAGVCAGLALASVAVFYVDAAYVGAEDARIFWVGLTYFATWFAATLYAFFPSNAYRASRSLIQFTGIGLLGLPVVSAVVGGEAPWTAYLRGHVAAPAVDLTLLVLGLICLLVATRLPIERLEAKARKRQTAAVALATDAFAEKAA